MRTVWSALLASLGIVALGLQLVPLEFARDNPPATAPLREPAGIERLLRRACYDCHSGETRWPWYSWVAPISWGVMEDVAGGRARLDFSAWEDMREGVRRRHARKIVERVQAGEMPMPRYLWLHPGARVTPAELEQLVQWRDALEEP